MELTDLLSMIPADKLTVPSYIDHFDVSYDTEDGYEYYVRSGIRERGKKGIPDIASLVKNIETTIAELHPHS